ncbi:MAG: hypothetical protein HRU41_14505 [Saprospiraceae bacterium]|nr:hypothetical protein [Saprospiraceae bacterium]
MIDYFKLVNYRFEPIRESLTSTYTYEWTTTLMHYRMQRTGRINGQNEGTYPLPERALDILLDFLLSNDLLTSRNIIHDPYNHPSGYQGADGLDIEIECQIGGISIQQHYRGTSVQLETYAEALHELWRLVDGFVPQAQNS